MSDCLFDLNAVPVRPDMESKVPGPLGQPRLRTPQRHQIEFRSAALDQLLPANHPARVVWELVAQRDVGRWLSEVKAVEGHVGRDHADPRLWIALWVYATVQGEGSAREIARLCGSEIAYQWLCGGVSVNHHTLSDFRSQGGEKWDDLRTQLVAGLMAEGLVTLQCVAQDGMRVRAAAGSGSFRRRATLERCYAEAQEQVATLPQLAHENPEELNRRRQAARERGARERVARIAAAITNCSTLQTQREQREVAQQSAKGVDPYAAKPGDSPAVAAWRQRMGTAAGKQLYKWRAQTAEWVNAQCRNRGLDQMPVRSQPKCRIVALLYAIAHHVMQAVNLRAKANMTTC